MPSATRQEISPGASTSTTAAPVRTLTAGLNAWAAADLMPWWYLEQPTRVQTFLHMLPAAGLALVVFLLARAEETRRNTLVPALVVLFPVSVGLAVAAREAALDSEMPTSALLYCVLSMWVFVGIATTETRTRPSHAPGAPTLTSVLTRFNVRTLTVVAAALSTVVVAPRWLPSAERAAAWLQVDTEGRLFTVACATALSLGVLLVVMGPESLTPSQPTRVPLRQRLVPPLLAGVIGAVVYAVIANRS